MASLVAKRLGGVNWWADLSSVDESSLPAALDRLLVELRNADSGQIVILDDFPVGNAITQSAWFRFNAIIEEWAPRSHFLAFTAKGVHPKAIDPRLCQAVCPGYPYRAVTWMVGEARPHGTATVKQCQSNSC
ncbi:hypothetical protein LMG28138_04873 [Pararobbsia alpina]|uniref:Uncharacterized protein n=1 Tax=Pararobbsia alpina TaxID=621374 RepID=A0A6S7BJ25_9BURK|nr:hypothetical protein LMG28138_04873 [Pararobbsia alpina]